MSKDLQTELKTKKIDFSLLRSKCKKLDNTFRKPENINFNLKQMSRFDRLTEH